MALPTSYSKLRRLVLESSNPELKQLESQLLQSYANKLNSEACRLKEDRSIMENEADRKFEQMLGEAAALDEERHAAVHSKLLERQTTLDLYRKEQAAARHIREAQQQCEEMMVDLALSRDVHAEMQQEKTVSEQKKAREAQQLQEGLQMSHKQQQVVKTLHQIQDQREFSAARAAAEVQQLREEVQKESQQLQQALHNRSTVRLGTAVLHRRTLRQEVQDLRVELEAAERQERADQQMEARHRGLLQQEKQLAHCRERQIRMKAEMAEREAKQEKEYLSILVAVQELECDLDQLTAAARRRRLAQRADETRRLLLARRLLRQRQHLLLQQQDVLLLQYCSLRSETAAEEERLILLEFAPHLFPHMTPQLLCRLERLHTA